MAPPVGVRCSPKAKAPKGARACAVTALLAALGLWVLGLGAIAAQARTAEGADTTTPIAARGEAGVAFRRHRSVLERAGRTAAAAVTARRPLGRVAMAAQEGTAEGVDQGGGTSSNPATGAEEAARTSEPSSLQVFAAYNSQGELRKHYYGYRNVRLTRRELQFFNGAAAATPGPQRPHWVDVVSGNASTPEPPTMLVIKGEAKNTKWYYMPVKHLPGTASTEGCKGWVEQPAYLLQVRYSHNIWHTWNEGLLGAFQTLREQGALPLVQIDAGGSVRELQGGRTCPFVHDAATNSTRLDSSCASRAGAGAATATQCDAESQPWCRPGVWRAQCEGGPLIVAYTPASIRNSWSHLYKSISSNVRDLDELEGFCFRNLLVGKTSILNFYQANNASEPAAQAAQGERVEAMGVFKAFLASALQAWEQEGHTPKFQGYRDAALERLRRGIGPEDIALAETIMPAEVVVTNPGEEAEELHRVWEQRHTDKAEGAGSGAAAESDPLSARGPALDGIDATGTVAAATAAAEEQGALGGAGLEFPRPVVTYMARRGFSRSLLNEHDLVRYILSRYNVTLRVTTFQEPLLEVVRLLQHTDVLIGMHGAGWTNPLFIKRGATALQLYPYGWRLGSGEAIRGFNYREIVLANQCKYLEWYNEQPEHAFFRREDFPWRTRDAEFHLHPIPTEPLPTDGWPGNKWVYQNTYADMASLGPVLDEAMRLAGIPPFERPLAAAQQ